MKWELPAQIFQTKHKRLLSMVLYLLDSGVFALPS